MKLLRLALTAAALCAAVGACNAARLTAPDAAKRVPPHSETLSDSVTISRDDQTMGSGG